jgi:hypothetical protein
MHVKLPGLYINLLIFPVPILFFSLKQFRKNTTLISPDKKHTNKLV